MVKRLLVLYGIIVLTLTLSGTAKAALINPGFETGDLTGWTLNAPTLGSVVTSFAGNGTMTYLPVEGSYFAQLQAGVDANTYTTLTQTLNMSAGETINGQAAFVSFDYMPWNDDAYVQILDSNGSTLATPWSSDVATVGDYGNGPWTYWSWSPKAQGTYTLQYGVRNIADNALSSVALFDANPSAVPEPASLSLLGLGLLGLLRKRKKEI